MAKKKKPRDYHEPWETKRSESWKLGYQTPPKTAESPEELRIAKADWEVARSKAEKGADILIMGSRMSEADVVTSLLGTPTYCDDKRIITSVRRILGLPEGSPSHQELAQRAVDCVNAMAGVPDPIEFIGELVAFLTDMASDPIDDFFGGRATRLLFKVQEHQELIAKYAEHQDDSE